MSSRYSTEKTPRPNVIGEWGWKDGWFLAAGLLAASENQGEPAKAEKGGGGELCPYHC